MDYKIKTQCKIHHLSSSNQPVNSMQAKIAKSREVSLARNKTWELSPSLSLTIHHEGMSAPFLKLDKVGSDETRSISFPTVTWQKLRKHIPKLQTKGYRVELNSNKKVVVKPHGQQLRVCFHNVWYKGGDRQTGWIKLGETEWSKFIKALEEIDQVIPPRYV